MKIRSFLIIVIGTLICAIAFNIFFSPYHIVSGGLSGIAVLLNYLFNFSEALVKVTTILVGKWVILTADSVLLIC